MNRIRQTAGEGLRFALVGAFATALHYALYYLLLRIAAANAGAAPGADGNLAANVAYTLGYAASFVANFFLTARFTFATRPSWRKFAGMVGAHAVNYVLHIALLNAALATGIPKPYAPLPVFAIAIPVNFLLVRRVFKMKK